jgi:4-hydroxybenzoate polyprenyltransferase
MPGAMSATTTALPGSRRLGVYASFVRFEHTLFSLPLIVAGVFSAPGPALSATRWLLIAVAAVGARTSAMALNRLIDRRLDALNPRTQTRELPAGRMKLAQAVALLLASTAAYLLECAALGPWYLRVAGAPLVVFTGYPYLKRFTPLCHFGVGLALALAPLAGYAAAHPGLEQPGVALWLAGFALAWVSGFDIIYATLDEEFDRSHGVHSMVAWLGRNRAMQVSGVLHLIAFSCLLSVARVLWNGPLVPSWTPWAIPVLSLLLATAAALLYLEQRWAEDVNLAFFKVNVYVGFVVLAIVLVARAADGGFFEHTPVGQF